jgi:hypothetical protein
MPADVPVQEVAEVFAAFPAGHRRGLLELRTLILDVAEEVGAAPVHEALRWGQPSYQSVRPHESTTIRLGANASDTRHFRLFFHCRSTVLRDFRSSFPTEFRYDGDRAILFLPGEDLQADKLRLCIGHALRYRAVGR